MATTGGEDVHQRRATSSKVSEPEETKQTATEGARSWASVAAGCRKAKAKPGSIPAEILAKLRHQLEDSVVIEPEVLEQCRQRWKLTLFGRFLGKGIPMVWLKTRLAMLWEGIEGFSISDMAEGYYVFRFEKQEDLDHVLTNGPWTVQGQVLNLIPWRNNFRPSPEAFTSAPVWIQLHNLPQEYWELEALIPVAAFFGKPLRVDETTLDHSRSRFARVCIEVDLSRPLKTAVWLGLKDERVDQRVQYESIPIICFKCGRIGHKEEECAFSTKEREVETPAMNAGEGGGVQQGTNPNREKDATEEDHIYYGPWCTVHRKSRRQANQTGKRPSYANGTTETVRREQSSSGTKDGEGNPRAKPQFSQRYMAQGKERNADKQGTEHYQASTSRKAEQGGGAEQRCNRHQDLHAAAEYVEKKKKTRAPNKGVERVHQNRPYATPITSEGIALKATEAGPGRRRHVIGEERMEEKEAEPAVDTEGDHLMPEVMEADGREGSQSRAGEAIGRSAVVQGITVLLGSGDRRSQRGARKKEALDRCRVLIRDHKLDMLVLLETHTNWPEAEQVAKKLGRGWQWFAVPAQGRSGGILVLWNKELGWVDVAAVSRYAAHLTITLPSGQTWIWTTVYASTNLEEQHELWEELKNMVPINVPWAIMGDFNAFLSVEEKRCSGVAALGPKGQAFARFVDESGLCDLGYEGIPYTWCNNQQGARRIWIRLDRALANTAWVSEHPECKVQHLDRGASDHAPLLLTVPAGMPRSKRPFRFELLWMEYEECLNVVQESWKRHANGNPMQAFTHRLSELRRSLTNWNRSAVGNVERRLRDTNQKLADLEELDANGLLSEEGTQSLRSCYNYKLALNRQLNIKWLQRSRLKWTEEGDRNTKFFHLSATMRRRRNSIVGIQGNDGAWFPEPEAVSRCFTDFYHRLWG
ncbi:uncharacterized protein [Typha latifolia]|uniref:uncharacterized protein n=1 Tax=Typha latifolia TaxID=4733 RepID=UPI003C2CBBC7